jgi:O-antigen/teichoic acid export membrane protein
VGRWAGVISLAFYRKGSTFARLPLVTLVNNAIGVVLPVYVKYRDDKRKTVFILSQFTRLTIGAMGLIYGVLFVVADPFVVLVLGEPWRTIIPFFRLFCILSFIKTFTHNISDYLSVSGLQRVSIKNEFFLLIWIVIFVSLLSFWLGIRGIVIGLICAYLPSIVYLYRQLKRYKDISLYGIALRGFLVFAASMWLSTWLIRKGESLVMGNWNQVILKAGIYGLVYGVLWIVVEGKQAYQVWAAWKGLNVVK